MTKNNNDARIREEVGRLGFPAEEMLEQEVARLERGEAYAKLTGRILAGLILLAAVIVLVTGLWLAVLQVDGSSMNPLLRMDEIVLAVNSDNPARNDVIAFTHNNKLHAKRVIAVAGDRVEIGQDGAVSVNGQALREPYVSELSLGNCDIEFPFQVPTGTVFVMGDNRPSSMDSRNSRFGTVDREQIVGKVLFRLWPLTRLGRVS
ncbi:MAG: signal peptidase I [Defluviitaleaceae bacterium]|nr:signal peptidase I [Defluviitaleaceae bacterium]